MNQYHVLIIGGGPIGSQVAYRLAALGHKVAVLERKPKLAGKICCTGIVGQECVKSFNIDREIILRQVNSARLFSPSGNVLRLWREEPQAYVLDRPAFDIALARRAQDKGAEYWLETSAEDIEIKKDRVKIATTHQSVEKIFEARAGVIATGFGAKLAENLGLGRFGDFVTGAQAEVTTTGIDEVEVYFGQEIAPGFFGWLVPTSARTARVGLLSRKNPGEYLQKLLASLLVQGKIASSGVELNYGAIPLKPLPKTYRERLLVVGDAAGQVKPTTGGGIYYGLLCANLAAETLHQALLADDLSAKSLAQYERAWKGKLRNELKIGYWARKIFERLSDRQIDRIFDIVKANGIDQALLKAKDLSFDWHSKAILALLGHRVVAKAIEVLLPIKATRN